MELNEKVVSVNARSIRIRPFGDLQKGDRGFRKDLWATMFDLDIYATHGSGGSSNPSADLRNLEQKIMPFWDCDIFLRGHSTKVYAVPGHPLCYMSRVAPYTIKRKQRWLVNTGGFMEGRLPGKTSYVEQAGLPSCALGWAVIEVTKSDNHRGRESGSRNIDISVKVETPE